MAAVHIAVEAVGIDIADIVDRDDKNFAVAGNIEAVGTLDIEDIEQLSPWGCWECRLVVGCLADCSCI
mgnify:CR=1 FL=1